MSTKISETPSIGLANKAPSTLLRHFTVVPDIAAHTEGSQLQRLQLLFGASKPNTEYLKKSLSYRGAKLSNFLPT